MVTDPNTLEMRMTDSNTTSSSTSIMSGVPDIIDRHLGLIGHDTRLRLRSKAACRALSGKPPAGFLPERLIDDSLEAIIANRAVVPLSRLPSQQNWRFEKKLKIAPHSKSLEKTLEKAIARSSDEHWANQVPTASGLANGRNDRHRNVDLVHRVTPGAFEFIELKVESDTPPYAAIEALLYGVLYMYARLNLMPGPKALSPIMSASHVSLQVLAPCAYYQGCNFDWLQLALNDGLKNVTERRFAGKLHMDFAFTTFEENFAWPCNEGDLVRIMADRQPVNWPQSD